MSANCQVDGKCQQTSQNFKNLESLKEKIQTQQIKGPRRFNSTFRYHNCRHRLPRAFANGLYLLEYLVNKGPMYLVKIHKKERNP